MCNNQAKRQEYFQVDCNKYGIHTIFQQIKAKKLTEGQRMLFSSPGERNVNSCLTTSTLCNLFIWAFILTICSCVFGMFNQMTQSSCGSTYTKHPLQSVNQFRFQGFTCQSFRGYAFGFGGRWVTKDGFNLFNDFYLKHW